MRRAEVVAAERARVATEGWGARLLALQAADGAVGRRGVAAGLDRTMHVLALLRGLGLDPASDAGAARGGPRPRPRDLGRRRWWRPAVGRQPLLRGRGRAVHQRAGGGDRRLLRPGHAAARRPAARRAAGRRRLELRGRERLDRSSFNTTIYVLEGLLEHERGGCGRPAEVAEARLRGEEYLLERRLFRRRSTGEVIDPSWLQLRLPDLVALRRAAGARLPARRRRRAGRARGRGDRAGRSKRDADGRWPLEQVPGRGRSRSRRARASRAAGTRCAPCACSTGPPPAPDTHRIRRLLTLSRRSNASSQPL